MWKYCVSYSNIQIYVSEVYYIFCLINQIPESQILLLVRPLKMLVCGCKEDSITRRLKEMQHSPEKAN